MYEYQLQDKGRSIIQYSINIPLELGKSLQRDLDQNDKLYQVKYELINKGSGYD